jgi:hypothetical protein
MSDEMTVAQRAILVIANLEQQLEIIECEADSVRAKLVRIRHDMKKAVRVLHEQQAGEP